jgi:hypothetical protein
MYQRLNPVIGPGKDILVDDFVANRLLSAEIVKACPDADDGAPHFHLAPGRTAIEVLAFLDHVDIG